MDKQTVTNLQEEVKTLEASYNKSKSPEDRINLLEKQNELNKAESDLAKAEYEAKLKEVQSGGNGAAELAKAITGELRKGNLPPQLPTKQRLKELIKCHECVVEYSEANGKDLVLVQVLRKGIQITKRDMDSLNSSLNQARRAIVYIEEKKAEELFDKKRQDTFNPKSAGLPQKKTVEK